LKAGLEASPLSEMETIRRHVTNPIWPGCALDLALIFEQIDRLRKAERAAQQASDRIKPE